MAASRISVEIAGSSASLQAAVAKAADSLKGLGDVLARQTDVALASGDKTVKMNQAVAASFQRTAAVASTGSKDMAVQYTRSADEQVAAANRVVAAIDRQAISARDAAAIQARAARETGAAAARSADQQVASSRRAADANAAAARKSEAAFGAQASGMTKMGKAISLGLVGAAAASVDLAVKFQANTLRVQTQAGATAAQLNKLRLGVLAMAGAVGYTPNQLANGLYHVVSSLNAVLPASQRVTGELKVLRIAAEGAQVGHSNLEETTYALASAMNALHAPVSQAQKVMGTLNAIVGTGDMTMQDLIDSFKSGIVPSAREAGISLQSLGAAMAVMGDMGMRGSLAGTRLRMSIALLSSPSTAAAKVLQTLGMSSKEATSTSEAMSKALEKAGLRTTTLSADLRKPDGILVALQDLNHHLISSGLTATGAAAVMNKAFGGGRMGATITLLAQNTDRLNTKFVQIGQTSGQFGRDWQLTTHTLGFEFHSLVASAAALGTEIGTTLIPVVQSALRDFQDVVHWFQQGSSAAHALEIGIGTLATVAIGSYLISKLQAAIKLLREFYSVLRTPVGAFGTFMRGTAPGAATAGAGALTGGTGISGARGMELPGSIMNPITVVIEAGQYAGMSSMGAAGTVASETNAAKAEIGAAKQAGAVVPTVAGPAAAEEASLIAGETGLMASLKSGFSSLLGGLMKGGMIAGLGVAGSQLAGGAIGGSAGHVVSNVGTGAAIGAEIGSIVPGVGTLAGAFGGALLGGVAMLIGHAPDDGKKWASQFATSLPDQLRAQATKGLSKAYDNVKQAAINVKTPQGTHAANTMIGEVNPPAINQAAWNQWFNANYNLGQQAGQQIVKGFQSAKFPSTAAFTAQMMNALRQLPAQARPEAAKTMLAYAQGLEQNGQLPKGAVAKMLAALQAQFPPVATALKQQAQSMGLGFGLSLGSSLKLSSKQVAQDLAQIMHLDSARSSLTTALSNMKSQFDDFRINTHVTTQNLAQVVGHDFTLLKQDIATSTGQAKTQALAEFQQLKTQTTQYFQQMGSAVATQMSQMKSAIQTGSKQAQSNAGQSFGTFAAQVAAAMHDGAISTQNGSKIIAQALQNTLNAFGSKQKIPAIAEITVGSITGGLTSVIGALPFQGGGYIGQPGEKGRDQVPIVVGRGEAILNHPQQAIANQYLAPIGGLPGLYAATKGSLHYMADGGFAGLPRYATGGLGSPGAVNAPTPSSAYVFPFPKGEAFSWQQVDHGQDLEGPPGGPVLAIAPGSVVQNSDSFGGFGPFYPMETITAGPLSGRQVYYGHTKISRTGNVNPGDVISYTQPSANDWTAAPAGWLEIGFLPYGGGSGGGEMAAIMHQLASGSVVSAIGGGGGPGGAVTIPTINAPQVHGGGTIGQIVQAALGMATNAANQYAQSHAPGTTGGFSSAGLSGTEMQIVQQLASQRGWSVADWVSLLNSESNGSLTDTNPSSGAYGLAQFINGPSEYYTYGGNPNTYAGQLTAMANYIAQRYGNPTTAWAFHRAHNYYEQGGFAGMATGGHAGTNPFTHAKVIKPPKGAKAPKVKNPKAAKGSKPAKLPTLKPTANMPQGLADAFGQLDKLNSTTSSLSGSWQGYIDQLHGGPASADALVTQADGSQVVNWGSPTGTIGQKTGMIDPSTGQITKGIYDRLREIGKQTDRAHFTSQDTELGIDESLFSDYATMQGLAAGIYPGYESWLGTIGGTDGNGGTIGIEQAEIGWLNHVLNPQYPLATLGDPKWPTDRFASVIYASGKSYPWMGTPPSAQGVPWSKTESFARWIKAYVEKYKDQVAQVARLTELQEKLPAQKSARETTLKEKFIRARAALAVGSATSTFDASSWLRGSTAALRSEEAAARAGVRRPAGWVGSSKAWNAQAKAEREEITAEFASRRSALEQTAAQHSFQGRVSKTLASAALALEQTAEEGALTQAFDTKGTDIKDALRTDKTLVGGEKSYLTGLRSSISKEQTTDKATLQSAMTGTLGSNIGTYVDVPGQPPSQLTIDALTMRNITIPALLSEIGQLTGTAVPASSTGADAGGAASADNSQLVSLLQQLNLQLSQELALNEAQTAALASMIPEIPRYEKGGPVTADTLAMVHEGEYVVPRGGALVGGSTSPPINHITLEQHYHGNAGALAQFMDQRIAHPSNVRVISSAIGRRTSYLTNAPGGHRR